ncbi:MAG: hypothetical protein ACRCT7_16795, partial [Shewanella sp.]
MKITAAERRLMFMEMLAYWQGYARNTDLQRQFGITRQQAYQDFQEYQHRFPDSLHKQQLGYCFASEAQPQLIHCELATYLDWLVTKEFNVSPQPSTQLGTFVLAIPSRQVSPRVIAVLTHAIAHQLRLE